MTHLWLTLLQSTTALVSKPSTSLFISLLELRHTSRCIVGSDMPPCMQRSVCPVSFSFVAREGATCDSSLVLAGEFVQDISRHLQVIPCYPQSTNHSVLCVALRCELRYVVHMKILVAHAVVFLVFQGTCAKGSQHS